MKRLIIAATTAAISVGATAAAAATTHHSAKLPVLKIADVGGAIHVTGTPRSGATELDVTTDQPPGNGSSGASVGLIRLKKGVTPQQLAAGVNADGSNIAQFGSIQSTIDVSKGQKVKDETVLKAATYVIADLNTTPNSTDRTSITVPKSAHPASLPTPDATIKMKDFKFTGPTSIARGSLVRTVNAGKEQHMAIALKVPKGETAKQIESQLKKGHDNKVQSKIKLVGDLIDDVSPGAVNQGRLTLARGTWVLACFMTTPQGVEHTKLGMERTLVVR